MRRNGALFMNTLGVQNKKNRILLVDDDLINRELIKNIFSAHYTFAEAENGLTGLSKVEELKGELCAILLDVNMPLMSGIELLKILFERGITDEIPVFLITSHEEEDIAREAYELGVMDVITKPVTPFIILRRVQSVIELFRMREALSEKVEKQEEQLRENADTIDNLHRGTIEALATAIEFRDVESGEHTNRIYGITKYILMNTEMGAGFTDKEIESMAIGSIMHDIGKIAISDVILNKPGRLTAEEFEIMKQHTVKGATLMSQLLKLQQDDAYIFACDIARHHHERWDGRGYPDGLRGDEITVWSQVVSIADVYDALVSPRVYKKAFDFDTAVNMIKNGECGAFNPKLLEAFLSVEPDIRKWYSESESQSADLEKRRAEAPAAAGANASTDTSHRSRDVSDVLLLTSAVKSLYQLVILANLTENTYHIIDYDKFHSHTASAEGVFDKLISDGASTVPAPYDKLFASTFSRAGLLGAYSDGKRFVRLEHKQFGDDGREHWVETNVIMMPDQATGDILNITLCRRKDETAVEILGKAED